MMRFKKILGLFIFIIVIDIVFSILYIKLYSDRIRNAVIIYSESEVKKIVNLVINKSVNKCFSDRDTSNLFTVNRDNDGNIELIDFNTGLVNKYISEVTLMIEDNVRSISVNGENNLDIDIDEVSDFNYNYIGNSSVLEVTTGSFSKSFLLSNLGPNIPIRINIAGDVIGKMDTKVREYGINNAMLEVSLNISVDTIINTPFISSNVNVNHSVPIFVNVVNGKVPDNYLGSINNKKLGD